MGSVTTKITRRQLFNDEGKRDKFTMHFHMAKTNFFFFFFFFLGGGEQNFLQLGGPNENYGTHEKLSWGCMVGQISSWGIVQLVLNGVRWGFVDRN